ncbi:putative sulfate transporter 3.3 [Ananas comosus]|uniref:Putative sulfate transporter 3.3 n=1 Tax=Ananas comosus TaxID=4615 RepID=A0A199V9H5_ANACO|nr:putative sulfate transporter 3.3 [Ananas comosus]
MVGVYVSNSSRKEPHYQEMEEAGEIRERPTEVVVHKVEAPPLRTSLSKMKLRLKETFFPDDPFRCFEGQPLKTKWALAAKYLFPILGWAPNYSLSLFKSDFISGLTIASLAIPQAI